VKIERASSVVLFRRIDGKNTYNVIASVNVAIAKLWTFVNFGSVDVKDTTFVSGNSK
jgi:hypothetical protein